MEETEIKMEIKLAGYEAIDKRVKSMGNSSHVYIPVQWVNCRVKIIRLDPLDTYD